MPIENTNMFKTQSPYEQQIEEMKRRQQMAEMLQQQALQPLESQVAPGGMVVPTSPVLGLTKMLQAYMGGKQLRDIEKQRGELSERSTAEAQDFLRSMAPGAQQRMSPDAALAASLSTAPTEAQPITSQQRQEAIMGAGLSANPQMRIAAQLAAMEPKRKVKFGDVDTSKYTPESLKAAENADDFSLLVPVTPKPATPTVRPTEVMRNGKPTIIDALTGNVIGEGRPIASSFGKAPSGFRYTTQGELEPIPGGPNDPNSPKAMPMSVINDNLADSQTIKRLQAGRQTAQGFISDLSGENPVLPLSATKVALYKANQATSGVMGLPAASDSTVRYFELERFINEQVNEILSRAKGPQTDQDALRAKKQILDNMNDGKIVISGLKRLDEILNREEQIANESIQERNTAYGRGGGTRSNW
jgi:hypothetical protein